MKSIGKIGVIIPAVTDPMESELLNEIYNHASPLGYDIIVFTNSSNSFDYFIQNDYVHGEEIIYELLKNVKLDGILFAAGRFHSSRVIRHISDIIKKTGIPCVVLEMKQDDFPYIYTSSQKDEIFAITEHLITIHGYEKIYCLTGPEGSYEAEERLKGFRQAMERFDLESGNYFYGDFWKNSAKRIAKDISNGKIEMPEAVVCTNDSMAVALCDALKIHGIKVPEQIAVTGYDGNIEALSYEPVITTIVHKEKDLAYEAVLKINEMIKSEISEHKIKKRYNIKYGESCGCFLKRHNSQENIYYNIIQNRTLQEVYLNSNLMVKMSQVENPKDFTETVDNLAYLIPEITQLDICLCNNAFSYEKIIEQSNSYTQNMLLLLSKKQYHNERNNYLFETQIILPALEQEHEPQFIVLLPIHYDSWNIGYMAMYYENGSKYHIDTFLQYWRDSLANGLHTLSNKISIEHMNKVTEEYSVRDQLTGMLNKKGLLRDTVDFINKTEKDGGHCLMLVFWWSQYTVPPLNKNKAIDIVVANALTMLCSSDKLCARTGERVFAVLMQLNNSDDENAAANKFVIALEQMMQRLQGQPVFPEIPDINCDFSIVTSLSETEEFLNHIKNESSDKYSQKNFVSDYSVQLKRIRKEIYLSPQLEWTSAKLSDKLGISNGYFRKIYKLQFQIPFKEDHINARISKAKTLLSETNLTVAEIAAKCGFNNASHFMRTFKSKEGKTAVQFKKSQ